MSEQPKPAWLNENKIDNTAFENFSKEAQAQGTTPLAIAMENGFVDEEKHLKKEQLKSELPIINKNYFDTEPPKDIFSGYDFKIFKQNGLIPIAKWEEHTYFAKLSAEVTALDKTLVNPLFVLAPWTALKRWFSYWEKNQIKTEEKKEIIEGLKPVSQDTLTKINFDQIKVPEFTKTKITLEKPVSSPQAPQVPLPEAMPSQNMAPPPPPIDIQQAATVMDPFEKWKGYFEKSMLLSVNSNNQITIIKSFGQWEIPSHFFVTLNESSMFKIVADTQKPYHGYVSNNGVNKDFFDKVCKGIIPEHITICGNFENQRLNYFYLGSTTKENALKLNLNLLEEIAKSAPMAGLKKAA